MWLAIQEGVHARHGPPNMSLHAQYGPQVYAHSYTLYHEGSAGLLLTSRRCRLYGEDRVRGWADGVTGARAWLVRPRSERMLRGWRCNGKGQWPEMLPPRILGAAPLCFRGFPWSFPIKKMEGKDWEHVCAGEKSWAFFSKFLHNGMFQTRGKLQSYWPHFNLCTDIFKKPKNYNGYNQPFKIGHHMWNIILKKKIPVK